LREWIYNISKPTNRSCFRTKVFYPHRKRSAKSRRKQSSSHPKETQEEDDDDDDDCESVQSLLGIYMRPVYV